MLAAKFSRRQVRTNGYSKGWQWRFWLQITNVIKSSEALQVPVAPYALDKKISSSMGCAPTIDLGKHHTLLSS